MSSLERNGGRAETPKNAASHGRVESRSWLAFITSTRGACGLDSIAAVTSWTALQCSGNLQAGAEKTEIGVEESESCGHPHLAIEEEGKTKETRTRVLESRTLYEPCGLGNLSFR